MVGVAQAVWVGLGEGVRMVVWCGWGGGWGRGGGGGGGGAGSAAQE